jgi:hypothetical protein
LLAGDTSMAERPQVTIREDKSGTIIWSGLREAKVSSAADVMQFVIASLPVCFSSLLISRCHH